MKKKDWNIPYTRPCVSPELEAAGLTPLLSQVLSLRGIDSAEQARALLYGGEDSLHDPLRILDMDKARARILCAVERGEDVAVYGDYDVDGITAACLVTDYLRRKGLVCHTYIPDRNEEGYGLNCGALDTLRQKGVRLVITVDCGITAVEEAEYARSLGITTTSAGPTRFRTRSPSWTASGRATATRTRIWPGSASRSSWSAPARATAPPCSTATRISPPSAPSPT